MPALFRRSHRDNEDDVEAHGSPQSITSLIVNHLESRSDEEGSLSHREFREFVRNRARSSEEALSAIRNGSRPNARY